MNFIPQIDNFTLKLIHEFTFEKKKVLKEWKISLNKRNINIIFKNIKNCNNIYILLVSLLLLYVIKIQKINIINRKNYRLLFKIETV